VKKQETFNFLLFLLRMIIFVSKFAAQNQASLAQLVEQIIRND
jgi:hypothetical protein